MQIQRTQQKRKLLSRTLPDEISSKARSIIYIAVTLNNKELKRMGKKHRNRINGKKKNNHISPDAIEAEHTAHKKEHSPKGRKNGPGNHI